MFEIPETCEFTVEKADQVHLKTKTNGDMITITGVHFEKQMVATLAYLINSKVPLKIEIKEESS